MTLGDRVNRQAADVSRITSAVGVFVAMVDGLARVSIQGAVVDIKCDGWYPPVAGMPVRVDTVNSIMRVVGPAQTLSPRGTVTASVDSGTRAAITVDGVAYTLPVLSGYSPTIGHVVVVNWQTGHILGREAAAPVVSTPSTPGVGGKSFKDLTIAPVGSGKYDTNFDNWWAPPDPWASNNNKGIWVYGGRFVALAGANITRVEMFLPLITQAGAASIGLHAYPTIPGGEPTITPSTPLTDRNEWVDLPVAWGNHLRDNPTHGIGVLCPSSGMTQWRGFGNHSLSGVLRFEGTR